MRIWKSVIKDVYFVKGGILMASIDEWAREFEIELDILRITPDTHRVRVVGDKVLFELRWL